MSKSIDQKVVEMSFDNKNFEKNVTESMSTIDKLKSKLNFDDAGKSFQELEKKASKTEFNSFKNNIDNISVKFDAMQVAAITALTNITNKAVDAGLQLAKSLSIDQITSGFQKFGDKTTNVATLVAQGFDMETVNEQMEKLNWFTDETSYNFVDMVSNISKFTATGKDLEDSVNAMEGIATWAALSGQNAATASRAMYQISQSMGAGFFRREDYKSIQNASMDTREFRQNALDAAEALGVLHKTAEGLYVTDLAKTGKEIEVDINKFADSLTEGEWFTSDVMMDVFNKYSSAVNDIYDLTEETGLLASEVLDKYGGELDAFGIKAFKAAQEARTFQDAIDATMDATSTQFMNMFEIIFGKYDEAKVFWTDLANSLWDVFAGPVEELNSKLEPALTSNMYDLSELKDYSEIYLNGKTEVLDEVSQAFSDLDHYAARLLGSHLLYEAVDESGNKILDEFGNTVIKSRTGTNVEKILEYAKQVGKDSEKFESYLNEYVTQDEDLKNQIREFVSVYDSGYTTDAQVMWVLSERVGTTKEKIQELYSLVDSEGLNSDSVQEFINTLSNGDETLNKFIKDYVEGTSTVVKTTTGRQNLLDAFWMAWEKIGDVIETVKTAFRNVFPESQWSSIYGWTVKIKNAIERIFPSEETLSKIQSFLEGVFTIFKGIGEFLGNIVNIIKTGLKPLIDSLKEGSGSGGLTDILANLGESIKAGYEDFMNSDFINGIYKAVEWVVSKLSSLLQSLINILSKIKESIVKFFTEPVVKSGEVNDDGVEVVISRLDLIKIKFEEFKNWASGIIEKIKAAFLKIKDTFDKSGIPEAINNAWNKIKSGIGSITSGITNLFSGFKKVDTSGKDEIVNELNDLSDKVTKTNIFEKIGEFLSNGWQKIKDIWEGIKAGVKKAWELIQPYVQPIIDIVKSFVNQIKGSNLLEILQLVKEAIGAILETKLAIAITRYISEGSKILKSAREFVDGITDILGSLEKTLNAFAANLRMQGISDIIKSVGLALLEIAAALWIVAQIPQDKIAQATATIGTALTLIEGLVITLNVSGKNVKGDSKQTGIALEIFAIGTALLEISKALERIASIKDIDALRAASITMVILVAELVGAVIALNLVAKPQDIKSGIAVALELIAFANTVKKIAKAIKTIADIGDPGLIAAAAVALGLIIAEIIALSVIINNNVHVGDNKKAKEMLAIGITLKLVASSFKSLSGLGWEDIGKGLVAFSVIVIELGLLLALPFDKDKALAFGATAALVSVAMLILIPVMKTLASMSEDEYAKALIGVVVLSAIMAGLAVIMSLGNNGSSALMLGAGLALAALAILELVAALGLLSVIAPAIYTAAPLLAKALVEVIQIFILAIPETIGKIADALKEALPKIIELIVTLIQAACEGVIESLDTIINTIITIVNMVLDALKENIGPVIEKLMGIIAEIINGAAAGAGEVVTALINFFTSIFNALSQAMGTNDFDIEQILEGVAILSALFVAMTAITVISLEALATIAILNQIADGLNVFIEKIQPFVTAAGKIDPASMEGVGYLADAILKLTAASILEGLTAWFKGGADYSKFAKGLEEMAPSIANFGKEMAGVDTEGLKNSAQAALYLTEFANNLPREGGLLQGIIGETQSMEDFAQGLIDLAPKLVEYATVIKQLTDEDLNAINKSIETVKGLANMADSLPRHGGLWQMIIGEAESMGDFAQGLIELAPRLIEYADTVSELDDTRIDAINRSIPAVKALSDMADNLPRHGGLIQMFIGDNSLTDFAKELTSFAPHLVAYALAVSSLSESHITAMERSADGAMALVNVSNALAPQGNPVFKWLVGNDTKFSDFATNIGYIADGLKSYSTKIEGADPDRVLASIPMATALFDVSSALAPQGNPVISWLTGDNTKYIDFKNNIGYVAAGLKSYSDKVKGADIEAASNSISLATSLVEISNTIAPQGDSVISWFFGKQDLGTFGTNLESFGQSLKKYSEEVAGINNDDVDKSVTALNSIVTLLSTFKNSKGDFESHAIKVFGEGLDSFADKYKSYVKKLDEIKETDIQKAEDNLLLLVDTITDIPNDDINAIMSLGQALEKLADDGIHKFVNALNSEADNIKTAGENIIGNVITGINNKLVDLQAAADLVSSTITTRFVSHISDYQDAGKSAITNITEGMNAARVLDENLSPMANYVTDLKASFESVVATISFYDIGNGIIATFSNAISEGDTLVSGAFGAIEIAIEDGVSAIRSYYTDFHEAGMYIIEGLNEGIVSKEESIKASASNLGAAAFTALKDVLKERSPSKLTYEVGEYFTQGFANGISGDFSYVEETVNYISDRAVDEMTSIIARINERINDDLDDNFTITPVLDLSQIESDAGIMNRYLKSMSVARVGAVAASESMARRVTPQSMYNSMMDKMNSNTPQSGDSINNNNFYIQSNDPTEVANEVSRILQKQVERRTSVWE